jgi:hypothetical protein
MVRGWNDPGSRISVRFADNSEQRELRVRIFYITQSIFVDPCYQRNERVAREGEASPARLTIAQAALLNLHGKDLQTQAVQPALALSHSQALPFTSPVDGYQVEPFANPSYSQPHREPDNNATVLLDSLRARGAGVTRVDGGGGDYQLRHEYSATRKAAHSAIVPDFGLVSPNDLSLSFLAQAQARAQSQNGGLTPAEELILEVHSQGRLYGNAGMNLGVERGVKLPSPLQQQAFAIQQQQQQQTLLAQSPATLLDDRLQGQRGLAQLPQSSYHVPQQASQFGVSRTRHVNPPLPLAHPTRARPSGFGQQQHNPVNESYLAQSTSAHHQPRSAMRTAMTTTNSSHRQTPLLSNHQRLYQQSQHLDNSSNNIHVSSKRANHYINDKHTSNIAINSNNNVNNIHSIAVANGGIMKRGSAVTTVGSPFFEHNNQNHHNDAMRHNGDVHNYKQYYDNAQFVVHPLGTHGYDMDMDAISSPVQISPALTYNSSSSQTPSTMSPATPFFGTFGQPGEVFGRAPVVGGFGKK